MVKAKAEAPHLLSSGIPEGGWGILGKESSSANRTEEVDRKGKI